ncbi:signal peptidase I [Halarchaeum solikamskense]|uniref:hypothetical protein n=1 Tax=Halarchaeum nitratireducens TaxID=489913 RepID=UPI001B3B177C|nr:hypothetical protein [Halarchaeum solikamskense]MBP2251239.1 signal peptidase I [Halarchaeum solikamskense]
MRTRSIIIALLVIITIESIVFAALTTGAVDVTRPTDTGSMRPTYDGDDVVILTSAGDVQSGDIILITPPDWETRDDDEPSHVLHRALFHVEEGENWYDRADEQYVGEADSCSELRYCPAPRDGWITKGDNNRMYDQAGGLLPVVPRGWVTGSPAVSVSL